MVHCTEPIEGLRYLQADYRITCDEDWVPYAGMAGVAFAVYSLGIPIMYVSILCAYSAALHDKEHPDHQMVNARFSFIFRQYEPESWYWEIVMLIQKLLLTGVSPLCHADSSS